jgi:8-oxo-dGTP pyrophosphatase MutT (NUDIX family)
MSFPVLLQEQSLVVPYTYIGGDLWLLTGQKQRGFGQGETVFPGGKPQGDESSQETAIRELAEEAGLAVMQHELQFLGRLVIANSEHDVQQVHVYAAEIGQAAVSDQLRDETDPDLKKLRWMRFNNNFPIPDFPQDYFGWIAAALSIIAIPPNERSPDLHFISRIERNKLGMTSQQTMLVNEDKVVAMLPAIRYS